MAVEKITINSKEMESAIRFVKKLTKSMVFDSNMESIDWQKARHRNNLFYRLMPREKGVKYKKINMGKVDCLMATSENSLRDQIILYIHGGGFVTGSAFVAKSYMSMLAKYSEYMVYAPDYALAPEYKFPTGFDDCCEAFEWLIKEYPDAKISLVGESAGGNYCLGLALKYKNTARIASVTTHSPIIDFSGHTDHSINENKDFIVMPGSAEPLKRMYIGNNDVHNPYISPILGDYDGFPPLFLTCDANETLYADAIALYKKCCEAGIDVEMTIAEGTFHAFATTGTYSPETTKILEKNIRFIKKSANVFAN